MANKRKPDNVHLLKGTFQKSRHGDPKKKPVIKSERPQLPDWLPKEAKKEWNRICDVMHNMKILTNADVTILSQYCLLFSEMKKEKENFPAAKHTQLRLCEVELGLTPSARSKITVNNDDNEDEF